MTKNIIAGLVAVVFIGFVWLVVGFCTLSEANAKSDVVVDCWSQGPQTLRYHAETASMYHFGERFQFLIPAVIAVESGWDAHAVNESSGALGLMQIMPKYHDDKFPASWDYFDVCDSMAYGAWYLNNRLGTNDPLYPEGLYHALQQYSGNTEGYADRVLRVMEELRRVGPTFRLGMG